MNEPKPDIVQFVPHMAQERFFTVPRFGETLDEVGLEAKLITPTEDQLQERKSETMRFAAYIRISSDEQVGNFSVDAQKRAIDAWVKTQEGTIVRYYIDEAQSGRTSDRPEFLALRRDAKTHTFDAVIVHKFDRFARNRTDALAIKSLLRREYGIKVLSVSEPSEDSDGAIGALIEGIMECVADWYSRNLADETRKGKRERAMQGFHNNQAPFGFDKDDQGVLIPNEYELEGLRMAFELYVAGNFSDNKIARILNEHGYISKSGRPFSTECVRDMLQNRTYLGYVKYQRYMKHPDGRYLRMGEPEWFKGKHDAVIDQELFDECQAVRLQRASSHEHYPKHRTYLLRNLIYCADCVANMPPEVEDDQYGKMRPHSNDGYLLYRCRARDFGRSCPQGSVPAASIDEQVITVLKTLKPPADWRNRIVQAMGQLLGDQKLEERTAEIKAIIERMDFRWDNGFITDRDAYLEQRVKLQQELEKLTPIPDNDLETAADLLENFEHHWRAAGGDKKRQAALVQLIVARVWVRKDRVVAVSLRPNYHVAVGLGTEKPTELQVDFEDCNIVRNRGRRAWVPHQLHPAFTTERLSCSVALDATARASGFFDSVYIRHFGSHASSATQS